MSSAATNKDEDKGISSAAIINTMIHKYGLTPTRESSSIIGKHAAGFYRHESKKDPSMNQLQSMINGRRNITIDWSFEKHWWMIEEAIRVFYKISVSTPRYHPRLHQVNTPGVTV